ncbi:MAG: hypothetical protein V1863_02505, partial [Candidatus Omnitrophota bacterium]
MQYYLSGRNDKALCEFKKALLANPESVIAQEFINRIQAESSEVVVRQFMSKIDDLSGRSLDQYLTSKPGEAIRTPSDLEEFQKAVISVKLQQRPQEIKKSDSAVALEEVIIDLKELPLTSKEHLIDTAVGERLVIRGQNLSRFLITQPALLTAVRSSQDDILAEPKDLGTTYMHIWDAGGRRTLKFVIGPRRFEQAYVEQIQKKYQESLLPETFKVSYSIDGDYFMSGRGFGDQERKSTGYAYSSSVVGETPFGKYDTAVRGSRSNSKIYRVSNVRMGLTDAHYDQFKDIDIRWFDFTPSFNAFGFPATDLRGAMVDAPMFDHALHYTAFWGALPEGNYAFLSSTTTERSGLQKTKQAWLEGLGLSYNFGNFANLRSFFAHSYGPELSEPVLTNEVEGFGMSYNFGRFNIGTDMVYDGLKNISYTANSSLTFSKLRFGLGMTESNKNYASLFGGEPTSGSTSGSLSTTYRPSQDVTISNTFSATHDKIFHNPLYPTRPNYSSNTQFSWFLDPQTEFEASYSMDDQIGSISPSVVQTKELRFRKKLYFLRKLNTYLGYQNARSKNYSSPALDYNNNRIFAGLNFRVLSELYFFVNRELNLLRNKYSDETASPSAQEIGLNYYRQIFDTPFYLNSRIYFRDEEATESTLSYLSGEDRLEFESEVTYRPRPGNEVYLKGRITNAWAEKAGVTKHMDINISWGLRLLWDTAFRWQPRGGFDGYVFYDVNGDGIKQPLEKGLKGVQVKGPDGKTDKTDGNGYYKLSNVVGKKAILSIDLKSVPRGFNATTPQSPEVEVVHAKVKRVNFGLTTRTEISGLVFHDKNGNGVYEAG